MKRLAAGILVAAASLAAAGPSSAGLVPSELVSAGYQYLPSVMVIEAGTYLTFTNADPSTHSVTAVGVDPVTDEPLFDSGHTALARTRIVNGTQNLAPNLSGYAFRCVFHPGMTGKLIVVG